MRAQVAINDGDAVEAGLVASQLGQARLDHPPERVPGDTELAGQAFDGGVLTVAVLQGYGSVRSLSAAEQDYLPLAQQAACIRFWVSRLLDFHFPPEGELTFTKNPDVFRDLLLKLQ